MRKIFILLVLFSSFISNAQFNYEREWATYFGGENTFALDSATDSQGNVYLVGYMVGDPQYLETFITSNAYQQNYGGGERDGFVAKFSSEGLLIWSTFFGGTENDAITAITISQDRIFVGGASSSGNMATVNAHQFALHGSEDCFLSEFDTAGQRLWLTYYGGNLTDYVSGIQSDGNGSIYIYGQTGSADGIASPTGFDTMYIPTSGGEDDYTSFIAKFSDSGQNLLWGTYYGTNEGSRTSHITGLALSPSGLYVAGAVFDLSPNPYFATADCHQSYNSNPASLGQDMFLSKFAFDGSRLWSTYYGGQGVERNIYASFSAAKFRYNLHSVAYGDNAVYISGTANSNNNIVTPGTYQQTKQGFANFLAKFNENGVRVWGTYFGETGDITVAPAYCSVATDSTGEPYLSGSAFMNFLSSPDGYQQNVSNPAPFHRRYDAFAAKFSKDGQTRYFGTYYGGPEVECGNKTLLATDGFYILGTTSSSQNIATDGSHQPQFSNFIDGDPDLLANGFIVKFKELPLSVDAFKKEGAVIYPVPNSGNFYIRLNTNYIGGRLSIFDALGKIVHTQKITKENQELYANSLSAGIYILKIYRGDMLYEKKFLVE